MTADTNGVLKILIFFMPHDFTIALQLTTRPFGMSPDIQVVMNSRIGELEEEGYGRHQRRHAETERRFVARVFGLKPKEIEGNPIATDLLREIMNRTQQLVGRGK